MSIQEVHQIIANSVNLHHLHPSNALALHYISENTVSRGKTKTIKFTAASQNLCYHFSIDSGSGGLLGLRNRLQSLNDTFKRLVKYVGRNWSDIISFLEKDFILEAQELPVSSFETVSVSNDTPNSPQKDIGTLLTKVSTPVKTRTDCRKCPSAKKLNFSLKKTITVEKRKYLDIRSYNANLKQTFKVRENKQKIKRYEEKLASLKLEIKKLGIQAIIAKRKVLRTSAKFMTLQKQTTFVSNECQKLERKVKGLEERNEFMKKEVKDRDKEIDYLRSFLRMDYNVSKEKVISSKVGKFYSYDIRRCIYQELLYDVPVKNCGCLINDVITILMNKSLDSTPSQSTCAQMAYELGVLSTIMLAEFFLSQKELTVSWDATTIDGVHVNEIHVTANKVQCLVVDVAHLPGGKSADYVTHIVSALTECAASYARFTQRSDEEILTSVKKSIASTLTDRAAVNACVTRQLRDELDSQLLQLNCNVHPLDSIARYVSTNLVALDKLHHIEGGCYGKIGTAANLINAVSTLRFKDGTGDPLGFKNLLRENGLPMGTFVRYVGNRIHVLFHLAGTLVMHHEILTEFIEKQCTAAGLIRSSVLRDIKNSKIMAQVWALGVLGKILTGPWMTLFYSSNMSNLEMGPLIQQCVTSLGTWIESPSLLLHPAKDAFGTELSQEKDQVFRALINFESEHDNIQLEALTAVLKASQTVIERQLKEFLNDGIYADPSPEMLRRAANAPTHNMSSERTLGSFDKMWRRAPSATIGFLNGKVKCKMNKTLDWLDAKERGERESLIRFVVSEAREERVRKFAEQRGVLNEVSMRRKEIARQRQVSKKSSVVRELKKYFQKGPDSDYNFSCSVNSSLREKVDLFVNDSSSFIGSLMIHTIDGVDWYCRVLQPRPKFHLDVGYWTLDEQESSAIDFKVSAYDIFADVILGNIVFL